MQACGLSLARLLRPVGLVSIAGVGARRSYVYLVAVPESNQAFREIAFNVHGVEGRRRGAAARRSSTSSRTWCSTCRTCPPSASAGTACSCPTAVRTSQSAIYVARHGRVAIDREKQTVEMLLENGARHTTNAKGDLRGLPVRSAGDRPRSRDLFPAPGPAEGRERADHRRVAAARRPSWSAQGQSPHNELIKIHQKFSIPVACLVFGLIGIALGATNRRDGALGSFALGLVVIFLYYMPMYLGPALTKGGLIAAVAGGLAAEHRPRRGRAAAVPLARPGRRSAAADPAAAWRRAAAGRQPRERARRGGRERGSGASARPLRRVGLRARASAWRRWRLAGIFYISTFLDLSDKVFKGDATWTMLGTYFVYITPQYAYYILPLVGAAGGAGHHRRADEEQRAGRDEGLRHQPLPRRACRCWCARRPPARCCSRSRKRVLGPANRRAERLRSIIRSGVASTDGVARGSGWPASADEIYNYTYADPATKALLQVQHLLAQRRTAAGWCRARSPIARCPAGPGQPTHWTLEQGWTRDVPRRTAPPASSRRSRPGDRAPGAAVRCS